MHRYRLVYAYATDNIFPLLVVSVVGEVLSILYLIVYARWSEESLYVAKAVALGVIVFVPVTAFLILAETGAIHLSEGQTASVLGYLADAMNFFLYLSPLEKVKQVLVTKSAASIPVLMSITICANCALWFVTGIVDYDLFILVPNAIGTALSASQVVLYVVYRPGRHPQAAVDGASKVELPGDLEMQPTTTRGSPRSSAFQPLMSPLAPLQQ